MSQLKQCSEDNDRRAPTIGIIQKRLSRHAVHPFLQKIYYIIFTICCHITSLIFLISDSLYLQGYAHTGIQYKSAADFDIPKNATPNEYATQGLSTNLHARFSSSVCMGLLLPRCTLTAG